MPVALSSRRQTREETIVSERFLALLPVLAAPAVVGGVLAADSAPLPAPVRTDAYAPTGGPLLQVTPVPWGAGGPEQAVSDRLPAI
jgi:hypothetical protein